MCVCVIKSINYAHSDSKTKVLRRPPSLTEEGSMVLLLHMWPNDFPAARDLIRAAKSHPVPVVQICPPKKSILQNHQFISFMTIFWGRWWTPNTLHQSCSKSQWLATPKRHHKKWFQDAL